MFTPLDPNAQQHSAFFKFVVLDQPQAIVDRLRQLSQNLTGSMLVAQEGINGVVAGSPQDLSDFEKALTSGEDPVLQAAFVGMAFKRSACDTAPFFKMKVHLKKEIVALGWEHDFDPSQADHHRLTPEQWDELLAQDDVVVIDNRNSFEYRLGRFKNAIDPEVAHFRDFPDFMKTHAPEWKKQGKRIAMYCTGGIRCEKTAHWAEQTFDVPIYQLEGGILNYFQSNPQADQQWEGECFVFDNRVALDTQLRETPTQIEQVYDPQRDGAWRVARALRLSGKKQA